MKHELSHQQENSSNVWQIIKQTFNADLRLINDCDPEVAVLIKKLQLSQAQRALPFLIAFHIIASFAFSLTLWHHADVSYILGWTVAAAIPAILFWLEILKARRTSQPSETSGHLEISSVVLGIVWASIPIFHGSEGSDSHQIELLSLILAMIGIVALALARAPTAAILFIGLVSSAIAAQTFLLGGARSVTGTVYCIIYGIIVIGFIINSHNDFQNRSIASLSGQRQQDTIALLLNEFQNGSGDWLWQTDSHNKLSYFSPKLLELTGLKESEVKGNSFVDVLAPAEDAIGWDFFAKRTAAQTDISSVILYVIIKNDHYYWAMTARPIFDKFSQFSGYRGVCRDRTDHYETEQKVLQAMATAENANAAKTQFLAVMSHELRTPINAITGFSEVLLAEQDVAIPRDLQRDYLKTILESAKHLQLLINDILDATRMERGAFKLVEQPTDAAELVEVAAKMCRDQADKSDTTVILRLIDGIEIDCDLTRMKQVILNLMTNAIKFSPPGGIVNIEMRRAAGGNFQLAIADAGVGIKAEDIQRIFEPFVQAENGANRRFGGVGLGLAIARKIARLHGGDITLESQPGAGTTAYLTIPATRVTWPKAKSTLQNTVAA